MNQILVSSQDNSDPKKQKNKKDFFKKGKFFKIQFTICTFIALGVSIYYAYYLYDHNQKEHLSKRLVDNFSITNLYSEENGYSAKRLNANTYQSSDKQFSVIGLVEINSININYPILSEISTELLKIAPCKFYGPMPNEVGNMCIAGHNYNNYKFFSKLKNLNIGDTINIYDLSGSKVVYEIYNTYETDSDDFSCVGQETNGQREITLITCNNIKNKRRIIKATQKG